MMQRGEVKLKILFEDDTIVEATYFMLLSDLEDKEEMQNTITDLLYNFIEGKEDKFEGAVAEIDMQDEEEIYVCTFGPLSEDIIEWIREGTPKTLH